MRASHVVADTGACHLPFLAASFSVRHVLNKKAYMIGI